MSVNVITYGADPTGQNDSLAAFQAAIEAAGAPGVPQGSQVIVPIGKYKMSAALVVRRSIRMTGETGAGRFYGTSLRFDQGGLELLGPVNPNQPLGPRADGSVIEHLAILGVPGNTGRGILVSVPCSLKQLYVGRAGGSGYGFASHGIEVRGSQADVPASNANGWRVEHCAVEDCGEWGLRVSGSDSNAGYIEQLSVVACGAGGIWDSSFLGNTHVGSHVEGCPATAPAHKIDGGTNRSVLLGCYSELGQGKNVIGHPASIFGGNLSALGIDTPPNQSACLRVENVSSIGGFEATEGPGGSFNVRAAMALGADTAFRARAGTEATMALKREALMTGMAHWTLGGPLGTLAIRVDAAEAAWARLGLYLGAGTNRRLVNVQPQMPTTPGVPGDIVYNGNPTVGSPWGWIYVSGAWRVMGTVA